MKFHLPFYFLLFHFVFHNMSFTQQAFSVELKAGKDGSISDMIATHDSGYLCIGTTAKEVYRQNDVWLLKTGPDGNVQWSKRYGDSTSETGTCIVETSDGNYVAGGIEFVQDGANTFERIILIKVNPQGEKLWTKYINASFHNFANALCALPDGSVMLGGWINKNLSLDFTEGSTFLAVIDKNGNIIKTGTYGEPGYRRWVVGLFPVSGGIIVVSQNDDGGVFIGEKTAYAYSLLTLQNDTSKGYVFRVSGAGTHFTQAACVGPGGTLTISGTWGSGPGKFDACTVQFNKSGGVNWVNLTGGNNDYRPYDAAMLSNGDIMIAGGYTGQSDEGNFEAKPLVIWINKDGILKKSYRWNRPEKAVYAAAFNKKTHTILLAEGDNFTLSPKYPVLNSSDDKFDFCLPESPLGTALPIPVFTLKRKNFILRGIAAETYNKNVLLENYNAAIKEVCREQPSFIKPELTHQVEEAAF